MSTVPITRGTAAKLSPDIAGKLPENLDAERNVLGAILIDSSTPNATMKLVRECGIVPDDFHLEQNRRVFRNMLFLDDANQPIESVSIVENLSQNRELDAAGGAAYVASLMDGMPRLSNVAYYAKIVKEKSRLRQIVTLTARIQNDAISGYTSPDSLAAEMENFAKQPGHGDNPAIVVDFREELMTLKLPDPKWMMEPLLTHGGTMMLYSWAGWGKSFIATEMAFCISAGVPQIFGGHRGAGGAWPIYGPERVLYIYGEMHGSKIRERLVHIAKAHGEQVPEPGALGIMSKDYQTIERASRASHMWRPSICSVADRRYVEERIFGGGYKLLVLDNISTLWSAAQEDQSKQTAILKDWYIDLNMRGVMVMVLQHAGKSGDFLGDSAQIHILDSLLKLKHSGNYKKKDGLRAILDLEKNRYECSNPSWLAQFEAKLEVTPEQGAQWLTRPAYEAQRQSAFEMFSNKMSAGEIAIELGIHRSTAYRYKKEWESEPSAKHWTDLEEYE